MESRSVTRRLLLDTNVLIAYERRTFDIAQLDEDELTVAAVTVAEFRTGIELAPSQAIAAARARILAVILDTLAVLDYTERTAVEHARLLAHTRLSGRPRGAHDLIIAAHAAEHGRIVLSLDANAKFGNLPGVVSTTPE